MSRIVPHSPWTVFTVFLRLGLTSFGGPIAHLGYFHGEFVVRRRWLSERSYADLVALCQFLPGPASSQVGMAIGLSQAGFRGALAAWAGFTLPSAILLVLFALGLSQWSSLFPAGVLHGLKVVAVAVVAQAVWAMARASCTDPARIAIAAISACVVLTWPNAWGQVGAIVIAGVVGATLLKSKQRLAQDTLQINVSRRLAYVLLSSFFCLLIGLPLAAAAWPTPALAMVNAFYRAGSLVFGGGHVVLPLLQSAVVPSGWVTNETFVAGYGAAQAVPGPLFTFAAFLGASMTQSVSGWLGAAICLTSIFLPSFLLVGGALPFWEQLRRSTRTQAALAGVNAAVVGVLLAALYRPVWTTAVLSLEDFALALAAFAALMIWKVPPWLVVLGCGAGGWVLSVVQ
jgi:chromate transporter